MRLQNPCSTRLTFITKSLQRAKVHRFGNDHIGFQNRNNLRSMRNDDRDRQRSADELQYSPAPQKVALTFIGRYTNDSIVGCFGNVTPQPKTPTNQKNAPKLRERSFANGGSIPRNSVISKRSYGPAPDIHARQSLWPTRAEFRTSDAN